MATPDANAGGRSASPSSDVSSQRSQGRQGIPAAIQEMWFDDHDGEEEEEDGLQIAQHIENLRNEDERAEALRCIINAYTAKIDEISHLSAGIDPEVNGYQRHVRTIVRLASSCPHNDICEALTLLVEKIKSCEAFKVTSRDMVASSFIPVDKIPSISDNTGDAHAEFVEAFRADGRVSHMTQIMGMHPRYLAKFRETHNRMLWDEGPLDLASRHLIAIMAAGCHKAHYILSIHIKLFLDVGGNPDWLRDCEDALPIKIRRLMPLNNLLAFQPWRVRPEHFGALVKSGVDYWSLNELVQALCIMAHFHALSSFTLGCGVSPEIDFVEEKAHSAAETEAADTSDDAVDEKSKAEIYDLISKMRTTTEEVVSKDVNEKHAIDADAAGTQGELDQTAAEDLPSYMCSLILGAEAESNLQGTKLITCHEDFDIRSPEYSVLRTQEFSWGDQCFASLNRYYAGVAELFEDEFNEIKNLTYDFMGEFEAVDTSKFRWAIWTYVLRIKGILDDEYAYKQINKFLEKDVKKYVKTIVCYPQVSKTNTWNSFMKGPIQDSERVHINLLAMAARKQSELLLSLQALTQFVASRE